jgi:ABC-type Zn uptake system ZnuABC Zn-binding protein ZnuA
MSMRTIFISVALLVLPPLAFAACGSDDDGSPDGPNVVATTGIVADIAADVAGPDVDVEQIVPNGSSPHDFQLSAEDRQNLETADLVVVSGAGLEAGIPVDDVDAPSWTLTDHAGELLPFEEGGSDPHVWLNPARVADAVPSLANALAEVDPENADGYRERARAYATELRNLDRELEETLSDVPAANRELVTSHDSLSYFAQRYRFDVIATAFPASGAEAEASAATISEVEEAVRDSGVPTVFAGEEDDPETLRLIADETGVEVEENLLVESPGDAGTYEDMLRHDVGLIAAGLSDQG